MWWSFLIETYVTFNLCVQMKNLSGSILQIAWLYGIVSAFSTITFGGLCIFFPTSDLQFEDKRCKLPIDIRIKIILRELKSEK